MSPAPHPPCPPSVQAGGSRPSEPDQGPLRVSLFFLLDHYPQRGVPLHQRYGDQLELAVLAERLGFEGVFLAEHHFSDFGAVPNPAVLLAAVAARTTRLRLGPAVTVLPFRHPLQVVEDYAMVDQLSCGRLVLGVGSGSVPAEFHGFGLSPDGRREVFHRRLEIVDQVFRGRPGPHGAPANVPGYAGRRPPIYLATTSLEGARAAGARGYGLLTLSSPGTASQGDVARRLEAHAEGLAQHRHPEPTAPEPIVPEPTVPEPIVTMMAHLAETPARARAEAAPALERFLHHHGGEGADGFAVFEQMVQKGTGAFGTVDEVSGRLEPLVERGARHLSLWMGFGGMARDRVEASMRLAMQLPARLARAAGASAELAAP